MNLEIAIVTVDLDVILSRENDDNFVARSYLADILFGMRSIYQNEFLTEEEKEERVLPILQVASTLIQSIEN